MQNLFIPQILFNSKTVNAIKKEIDRLETIERDQANIQRVDNEITK